MYILDEPKDTIISYSNHQLCDSCVANYFCVQKLFLVVRLVISDWWAEPARGRAVWRSVLKESGAQSVMTHGVLVTRLWSAETLKH